MKDMAIILFLLSATICIKTATFGAPPSRHGIGHGRNPVTAKEAAEAKEANEKSKRRIAPYLTDEGASGRLTWKEYTVNPKAKGEPTLLVVFGGRDSVKDGRGEAKIPIAIEKAISHANLLPKSGRLIVLVPDMMVGESRRGGRETPVSEGMPKLLRSRMEKHGIKAERTFATGFSMGGGLVYNLLNDDPTLFARALVVGASGNPDATKDIKAEILDYHGADDDYIPAVRVKAFAEAVNAKTPGRMKLETLNKTGHAESETAAYSKNDAWTRLSRFFSEVAFVARADAAGLPCGASLRAPPVRPGPCRKNKRGIPPCSAGISSAKKCAEGEPRGRQYAKEVIAKPWCCGHAGRVTFYENSCQMQNSLYHKFL